MTPEVLRSADVQRLTGLSRTTIWRLSRSPDSSFPAPRKLTGKSVGWLTSEVTDA